MHPIPTSPEDVDDSENEGSTIVTDSLITPGWYTLFVLIVGGMITLIVAANWTFLIYAGSAARLIGCGHVFFNDNGDRCTNLKVYQEKLHCSPKVEAQFGSFDVEYGLYCVDVNIQKLIGSVEAIGALVGFLISGQLADTLGRKWVLFAALFGVTISCIVNSHLQSLESISLARSVTAFFNAWLTVIVYVWLFESIPCFLRLLSFSLISTSNSIIVPWLAMLCGEWRSYLKFIAILGSVTAFFLMFLCESPFFALQKGQGRTARYALHKIHAISGTLEGSMARKIDDVIVHERRYQQTYQPPRFLSFLHSFSTPHYALWSTLFMCSYFLFSVTNQLITELQVPLGSSIFTSVFWNKIFSFSLSLVFVVADFKFSAFGRKHILFVSQIFSIIGLLTLGEVFTSGTEERPVFLRLVAGVLLESFLHQACLMLLLSACELYPTSVRASFMALIFVGGHMASIISPVILGLVNVTTWLSWIFLFSCYIASMLCLHCFLLETKGTNIQNHFESTGCCCCCVQKDNIKSEKGDQVPYYV